MQQGGKVVYCTGSDCDFTEAKSCSSGSLQEQEIPASWPAPKEN